MDNPIPNVLLIIFTLLLTAHTDELSPPHSVRVYAKSEHSFTLSWDPLPEAIGFWVHYAKDSETGHSIHVAAGNYSQLIPNLEPDNSYTVYVSAVFPGNVTVPAPKFVVSTLGSEMTPDEVCDCDRLGTSRCMYYPPSSSASVSRGGTCLCKPGYGGPRCDTCADDKYHLVGDECQPCDCSVKTSSGSCVTDVSVSSLRQCSCLPGHSGHNCDLCLATHFWALEQCVSCECLLACLSSPETAHRSACYGCRFGLDTNQSIELLKRCADAGLLQPSPHRNSKQREGTVAILAVLSSLLLIVIVAGAVICYKNRCEGNPNTSTSNSGWKSWKSGWTACNELREEKISLSSAGEYQRLDAAIASGNTGPAANSSNPNSRSSTLDNNNTGGDAANVTNTAPNNNERSNRRFSRLNCINI